MQIRALILLSCLISGCSPSFDLTLEEYSCPGELLKKLDALNSVVQEASIACATHGDSENGSLKGSPSEQDNTGGVVDHPDLTNGVVDPS